MTNKPLEWHKARCPICQEEYEYLSYKPQTCGKFDCVYKFLHRETLERIAKMKNEGLNK